MRLSGFIFLGIIFLLLFALLNLSNLGRSAEVISPIGTGVSSPEVRVSQAWFPDDKRILSEKVEELDISAQSALSFDLISEKFLYKKNIKAERAIASLAKIMTAVVALQKSGSEDIFYVGEKAANIGEDSMGLSEGERYSLEQLLYGLFLVSGNDAAEAIAENVGGERETFVGWMNDTAAELGLYDTHFINPSGLPEGKKESVSTAYDILILTRYAIYNFPVLREISHTKYYEISYSEDHKYLFLENVTNLLGTYPGVSGFKTGYTEEAGLCLVTTAKNGDHEIIVIILKSADRRQDAAVLLDHSFGLLGIPVENKPIY